MSIQMGVVMDPIESIQFKKDSSLALMLEAHRRGWKIQYMQQKDLWVHNGEAFARMCEAHVHNDPHHWFDLKKPEERPLTELDVILMRKDPPFDMEYIYTTYILERAEASGVWIINKPQSLRDANEKFFTAWFPQCTPPTLIARGQEKLIKFIQTHNDIILKPLDEMGGHSIFRIKEKDPNTNVILETITHNFQRTVIAQRYLPEIKDGDRRIMLIDGKPVPHVLARYPKIGDFRGNLAQGASCKASKFRDQDQWLCDQISPVLQEKGLFFVGIDVIGDLITEINVTSPTCIREFDALFSLNLSKEILDQMETQLSHRKK